MIANIIRVTLTYAHKKNSLAVARLFKMNMAATYSPGKIPVPSAMRGLTSLFGMGRGEHPRQNHHKNVRQIIAVG